MKIQRQFRRFMMSRNYAKSSVESYCSCLDKFIAKYGQRLNRVSLTEINNYLAGMSYASIKQNVGMMKILYHHIFLQKEKSLNIKYPRKPKTLPKVFSRDEIDQILLKIPNLKHKCIILLGYSSGLRISEVLNLKPNDILSDRMQIFVKGGKGQKDRYTILSKQALTLLRRYYIEYKPEGYLFIGQDGDKYSSTSVQQIMKRATDKGTFHTLRHSFATHSIESGVPTRVVQMWLGHSSSKTTEIYTQLVNTHNFISPYDNI